MISKGVLGIELHDSTLNSVDFVGEKCLIALRPAYAYQTDAESGDVLGQCMIVDVTFEFDYAAIKGAIGELPNSILDGSLMVGSELLEYLIPASIESKDSVTMRLFMWPEHREIAISAQGFRVRLDGVPRLEEG